MVHSDLTDALMQIQSALDTILVWSHEWGLKVSTQKTKAMIFARRRKLPPFQLLLDKNPVEYVSTFTFLGVVLDRRLTWGLGSGWPGDLILVN